MSQGTSQPWPKAFGNVGDAHVDLDWMRWVGLEMYYFEAYKIAADRLVDSAAADPHLLFPIGYLYRQYLENHLKAILGYMRELNVMTLTDRDLFGHYLDKLWEKTRQCIETKWPAIPRPDVDLDAVEAVILDFHKADPTGQELRYSRTTKGEESLKKLPSSVSLGALRETIGKVYGILDPCRKELEAEISGKLDDLHNEAMEILEAEEMQE